MVVDLSTASDPEHHALVKRDHPEYRDEKKREISSRWFHRLKQRYPDYLAKHATQGYAVGRAQITRPMIDTTYSVLQTVLHEVFCSVFVYHEIEVGTFREGDLQSDQSIVQPR